MSCATCGHTMQGLGSDNFWCPRCGTLKGLVESQAPLLVERCREFAVAIRPGVPPGFESNLPVHETAVAEGVIAGLHKLWVMFGVAEAINAPQERPQ